MFHQIERELLNGEPGLVGQQYQLLSDLQLKEENRRRDIWELPQQESADCERDPKQRFKLFAIFSKLKNFSLKAIANK